MKLAELFDSIEAVIDLAEQPHRECELDSDTECDAEGYGDGNVGEHKDLRDATAAVAILKGQANLLDRREHAAVLTGLRLLERALPGPFPDGIGDILNDEGAIEPLDAEEIDDLCQRLNVRVRA